MPLTPTTTTRGWALPVLWARSDIGHVSRERKKGMPQAYATPWETSLLREYYLPESSMILLFALAGATNVGIHTRATQRCPVSMSNGSNGPAACTRQDFRRESVLPIPLDDSVQGQWMAGQDRPTTPENFVHHGHGCRRITLSATTSNGESARGYLPPLLGQPSFRDSVGDNTVVWMPRWQNLKKPREEDLFRRCPCTVVLRGYSVYPGCGCTEFPWYAIQAEGFGSGYKREVKRRYPTPVSFTVQAPSLRPDTNYVDIDPEAMCATRAYF
jgi:hypothetical protein